MAKHELFHEILILFTGKIMLLFFIYVNYSYDVERTNTFNNYEKYFSRSTSSGMAKLC